MSYFRPRHVSFADVPAAREMLRSGLSLKEAAQEIGVFAADLDHILWLCIGIPDHAITKRYRPMF